jgi:hypothetical protein
LVKELQCADEVMRLTAGPRLEGRGVLRMQLQRALLVDREPAQLTSEIGEEPKKSGRRSARKRGRKRPNQEPAAFHRLGQL